MSRSPSPHELAVAAPLLPLVLYDGSCRFCTAQAMRLAKLAGGRLRVQPLQSALASVPWVDPGEAMRALHLVDRDGRTFVGAAAVVRAVRLARPWLGAMLLPYHLPGVRWLADRAYEAVAARRYCLSCAVPLEDGSDDPPTDPSQRTNTGRPAANSVRSSTPPSSDSSQRE